VSDWNHGDRVLDDRVHVWRAIVIGVVLIVALACATCATITGIYVRGGFCERTVRRDLPPTDGAGVRPNWTYDTMWVKCEAEK